MNYCLGKYLYISSCLFQNLRTVFFFLRVPPFGYHPEQNEQQLNRINNSPDSIIFPWELKYSNGTDINKDLILAENFIKSLLVSDESKRLGSVNGFKEVYSHPWISTFTLK